jgi:hypothetical protein
VVGDAVPIGIDRGGQAATEPGTADNVGIPSAEGTRLPASVVKLSAPPSPAKGLPLASFKAPSAMSTT